MQVQPQATYVGLPYGAPQDIDLARRLYPNETILAAARVTPDATQHTVNSMCVVCTVGCLWPCLCCYPCFYRMYKTSLETFDNTLYIITENEVIIFVEDFDPSCAIFLTRRDTRSFTMESIQSVEANQNGSGCAGLALPYVDIVTPSDRGSQKGCRVLNAMFVDDVHAFAQIIKDAREKKHSKMANTFGLVAASAAQTQVSTSVPEALAVSEEETRAKTEPNMASKFGALTQKATPAPEAIAVSEEETRCFVSHRKSPNDVKAVMFSPTAPWDQLLGKFSMALDVKVSRVFIKHVGAELNNSSMISKDDQLVCE